VSGSRREFFFDPLAAPARAANPGVGFGSRSLDFQLPSPDGCPAHPGDRGHFDDTTMPPLLGQQPGERPPALFVERNEDSIDRLMLLGDISPGKLQTVKATTLSTRFLLVRHDRSPHVKENPGERIIPKMTKLFLYGS
jgi:hypothetical protein